MAKTHIKNPEHLVDRYVAVWSESDPEQRRKDIAALWSQDGTEFVEGTQFRGYTGLEGRVVEAYTAFVASGKYNVTSANDVTSHDEIVKFTIQLVTKGGEVDWAARVFLILGEDGLIREDYQLTVKPLPA